MDGYVYKVYYMLEMSYIEESEYKRELVYTRFMCNSFDEAVTCRTEFEAHHKMNSDKITLYGFWIKEEEQTGINEKCLDEWSKEHE